MPLWPGASRPRFVTREKIFVDCLRLVRLSVEECPLEGIACGGGCIQMVARRLLLHQVGSWFYAGSVGVEYRGAEKFVFDVCGELPVLRLR